MKTFVINLPQSSDRLNSLRKHLSEHPYIDLEVIEAVDGRILSTEETDRLFDREKFHRHYHRAPRPGEIGCTLSHQKAYRKITQSDVNTLIIEDDIQILRNIGKELEETDRWLSSSDRPRILLLGTACLYRRSRKHKESLKFEQRLVSPVCYAHGTYAYALNPEAARILLNPQPYFTADAFMLFRKYLDIEIKAVIPPAITPTIESLLHDSIVAPHNEPVKKLQLATRAYYRMRDIYYRMMTASGIIKKLEYVDYRGSSSSH